MPEPHRTFKHPRDLSLENPAKWLHRQRHELPERCAGARVRRRPPGHPRSRKATGAGDLLQRERVQLDAGRHVFRLYRVAFPIGERSTRPSRAATARRRLWQCQPQATVDSGPDAVGGGLALAKRLRDDSHDRDFALGSERVREGRRQAPARLRHL